MPLWAKALLQIVGGVSLLATSVAFLGKWLLDRVAAKVDKSFDARNERALENLRKSNEAELETLRAKIAEQHAETEFIRATITSGSAASHALVLDAVARLWKAVLEIRGTLRSARMVYDLITVDELKDESVQRKMLDAVPLLSEQEWGGILSGQAEVDEVRPFVGETLWQLFFVYRAVSMRLVWKVIEGKRRGRIPAWPYDFDGRLDSYLNKLVLLAMSDSEWLAIKKYSPIGVPGRIEALIESKLLSEMSLWIFGQRMTSLSLEALEAIRRNGLSEAAATSPPAS